MNTDIDVYGVYVPSLLFIMIACYLLFRTLHWVLSVAGFYRYVWHRPLFDIATYFVLFFGCTLLSGTFK
ncbi:DUF1656 domain-containing protein [Kosakonia radicincitans]|uniref:DUF1656 domain-containing protein n=2 Tax=Kosakonia radicincitans TaxID=283686 RepID=A0AAX2ES13_9ENTR|nr:hypothetical protein [Kosakonia oryzae]NCF06737.1 DUF1656 domain-containing protein [Kosakonia sp. MH5]PTA91916.1 DUF1656 domain-containing protein [Kosakonia sp. H7A]QEM91357.1 DUF1656 domain-containing protein [Kosakonia radicincitans]SES85994.1 Protein of unknown function [Kosakonia radicincitans]